MAPVFKINPWSIWSISEKDLGKGGAKKRNGFLTPSLKVGGRGDNLTEQGLYFTTQVSEKYM